MRALPVGPDRPLPQIKKEPKDFLSEEDAKVAKNQADKVATAKTTAALNLVEISNGHIVSAGFEYVMLEFKARLRGILNLPPSTEEAELLAFLLQVPRVAKAWDIGSGSVPRTKAPAPRIPFGGSVESETGLQGPPRAGQSRESMFFTDAEPRLCIEDSDDPTDDPDNR